MYFMDIFDSLAPPTKPRIYLSGNNGFLKEFTIGIFYNIWNKRIVRVNKEIDFSTESTASLFPMSKEPMYILSNSIEPKHFKDYMIKLSDKKMPTKYKKAGFTEIICGDLFPNQVEKLCYLWLNKRISMENVRFICYTNQYDIYSCWNTTTILSDLLDSGISLSHDGINAICHNLSGNPVYKTLDYFIDGKYNLFMTNINNDTYKPLEMASGLLHTIQKINQNSLLPPKTWYQNKLYSSYLRLQPYNINLIVKYCNELVEGFNISKNIFTLKISKLVSYLTGLSPTL